MMTLIIQRMVWLLFDMAKWINSGNYDQTVKDGTKNAPVFGIVFERKSLMQISKNSLKSVSGACQQRTLRPSRPHSRWVGCSRYQTSWYGDGVKVDTWLNTLMSTLLMVLLAFEEMLFILITFLITWFFKSQTSQINCRLTTHLCVGKGTKLVSLKKC